MCNIYYYKQVTVYKALYVRAFYVLTNLILALTLWGRYYDNPLFTEFHRG